MRPLGLLLLSAMVLLAACTASEPSGERRPRCYIEAPSDVWTIRSGEAWCNFPRAIPVEEWPKGS
jgi:outer membrane biogenesis lipoprotein LolB